MKRSLYILLLCVTCAATSFVLTIPAAPPGQATSAATTEPMISENDWTRASALDPEFRGDTQKLREAVESARGKLADLLNDSSALDDAILTQVEQVISSHAQLERRVAEHLVKIRHQLTPDQQKQLMGLASDSVRQGGFRWRGGRGPTTTPTTTESAHPGRKGRGWQRN